MRQILYFLLLIFWAETVIAQPGLFKYDVTPGSNSYPQYFAAFGQKLCFFAADSANGWEPWATDSAGPAKLISNVYALPATSSILPSFYKKPVCAAGGKLYFNANNGATGSELYSWTGNVGGVALAADISSGPGGSYPDNLVTLNSDLYFSAGTAAHGMELWRFNTTAGTPERLTDMNIGKDSSITGNLITFSGKIFFTAKTPADGNELFMYDPQLDTVFLAADINPGPLSSDPEDLTLYNAKLYFSADDGVHGRELFSYTGAGAPQRATDINAGVSSSLPVYGAPHIAGYKGKVYFSATQNSGEYHMYSYNPTNGDVALACSTNTDGTSEPMWLTEYGDKLYFSGLGKTQGVEMFAFDGTNPPEIVLDMCAGSGHGRPQNLTVIGTNLYFRANECGKTGDDLFRYNYITAGIKRVSFEGEVNLYPNPAAGEASLELSLDVPATLSILLTDIRGSILWQLAPEQFNAGKHVVRLPVQSLPAGVYSYSIYNENGYCAGGRLIKQ